MLISPAPTSLKRISLTPKPPGQILLARCSRRSEACHLRTESDEQQKVMILAQHIFLRSKCFFLRLPSSKDDPQTDRARLDNGSGSALVVASRPVGKFLACPAAASCVHCQ